MTRLLTLLGCLLVWSPLTWGHAALLSSTPAPGAVLEQAPDSIVLTFSEPVGVTRLKLFDPHGQAIATGTVTDADGRVRIPVHSDQNGTFLLSWRIISADGHPVGGTLDYSVGTPSTIHVVTPSTAGSSRDVAIWLTRWLTYLCLFATAGATFFRGLNTHPRQRWVARPLIAGALLLPLDLGLQGLDMRDVPWSGLLDAPTWSAALSSTYTLTLGFYALALLLAAAALRSDGKWPLRGLGAGSLLLVGLGAAASGHAGTAPPQWLSRPAATLHVMAAIAWVGALAPLACALKQHLASTAATGRVNVASQALQPLARFSRWITPVVALLAASGLVLAYLQLDQLSDLWQTHYGQVLIAKLTLVSLLLCLAAYNRWGLTQATLSGARPAAHRLERATRLELVLATLILAVVALWRLTPPPRSLDAGQAMISAVTLVDSHIRAQVNPGPGIWDIHLTTPQNGAFSAQAVTLLLSNPEAGIEPMRRKAAQRSPGLWQATVPALPTAGKWKIAVEIRIDDFDQVVLQGPSADTTSSETTDQAMKHSPGMANDARSP